MIEGSRSLFLAGGISNCEDWQPLAVETLMGYDFPFYILNPRRKNFPMNNPSAAKEQIEWEHYYLQRATAILFWFPPQTLCPITLYELGAWSMVKDKKLFVGADQEYARLLDLQIQTRLARPEIKITSSLNDLCVQVTKWVDDIFPTKRRTRKDYPKKANQAD